ncbi:carboxypeptidase-like regulatory domain-containing protein, partial [Halodesulfurarchaeum sp. HSR-GB]|uniref:carboxypeptidase-like regulatory domain-containing protein n=1 Tax=Halodesulfurarchaeum sp. HSR-GB TaxID=3074077 RepID=UPI00285CB9EA
MSFEGLEEIPEAVKLYDDPIDEILHASKCANGACPTGKIKPEEINKQIDKSELEESEPLFDLEDFSFTDYITPPRDLIRSTSWKVIGVIFLFVLSATFATLGGFGGGGGIVEAGDSYEGIETTNGTTPEAVYEDGNWTVYRSGDSYIVSGVIQGSIVFLTKNGEVTDSPYRFDNSTAAKEAIALWRARNDKLPSEYPMPDATKSLIGQVNWQVFSYNGSHIVAGKIDDRPVFLQPNGEYTPDPYFYDIRGVAEQSILYWAALSQTNDLPAVEPITKSELQNILSDWDTNEEKFDVWNSTDLGNWTVYTNGSAYVATASIDNETVFLQPDSTVSTSTAYFDSPTSLLQPLNTWRDNNPGISLEPISKTPDLGSEWEPIDNQDAIEDDLRSDELTTTLNDSISSNTGATIAGTVKDVNDQPVPDATVTFHSDPQTTTTDSSGEFVFTGVPESDHTIHVAPPDGTDLAAPRNTSIQVNEDGEISTQNDPENVLYFENEDGTISQNRLIFLAQEKQPIEVSGGGSEVSSTIQVANPSNINDLEVTLIPEYSATEKTKTLNGTDTSDQLSINGSSNPQDQTIFLQSEIAQKQQTVQGKYTGSSPTIDPIGNIDPTNFKFELEGNKREESTEKSGTATPSDPNAYTYDGNLEGSATITVEDHVQEIGQSSDSGTWSGGSINLPVEGNAPAKDVQITLTGQKGWTTTYSIRERQGGTGWDLHYDTSSTGHVDVGDTYKVYMSVSTSDRGDAEAEARASTPQEYLRADSGSYYTPDSESTSYTGYISPSDDLYVQAAVDVWGDENDWYDSASATAKITLQRELPTQTVTLQGKDKTYEVGPLSNGETRTITIDEVPADGQIGVSTSGYPGFDYSASWTEQQAPEDISIQKNGNTIWSQNGVFYDSTQTISVSSLSPEDEINITP